MYEELIQRAEAELPDVVDYGAELRGDRYDWCTAARRFRQSAQDLLIRARAAHGKAEGAVIDRYAEPLDALELLRLLVGSMGRLHEQRYEPDDALKDTIDWESEALRQIFWTGHLVAAEVVSLLRAGYPSGALARWRALYEVVVRASLLSVAEPEIAERYVAHEQLRERRQMRALNRMRAKAGGHPFLDEGAEQALEELDCRALDRYGQIFSGEHGWAHDHLLATSKSYRKSFESGKRERGPNFVDVSRAADPNSRPLGAEKDEVDYRFASFAVHGSPVSARDLSAPVTNEIVRGRLPSGSRRRGYSPLNRSPTSTTHMPIETSKIIASTASPSSSTASGG